MGCKGFLEQWLIDLASDGACIVPGPMPIDDMPTVGGGGSAIQTDPQRKWSFFQLTFNLTGVNHEERDHFFNDHHC